MSQQATALRELTAMVHEHAIDVRIAARKAGWSDRTAQRVADFIAMGTFYALGNREAEAATFVVADLFDDEAPSEITDDDKARVRCHLAMLNRFMRHQPPDDEWLVRPKRQFVGWPAHARPKRRPPIQPEVDHE